MVAGFALAMGSCAYDPMVGGPSGPGYGGGYGYGDGYGYGYSGFSTSLFISTGDPRWGYDPYCHSYYDYTRRCYYDPYLSGYYPMGYRPVVVVGVPHPYGYSRSFVPPPSRVRNYTLTNYHNRAEAYQHTNYAWAHQVRASQVQPRQTPYSHTGNLNYPANRNLGPGQSGYPKSYTGTPYNSGNPYNKVAGNPAIHGPAGQTAKYHGPVQGNPQVKYGQAANAKYNHPNAYQGGTPLKTGGVTHTGAPQLAPKGRGLGQVKEGKQGKPDREGNN